MRLVRSRVVTLVALLVLIAASIVIVVVVRNTNGESAKASSALPGHAAARVEPGAEGSWRSDEETVGAWVALTWESPIEVARVRITPDRSAQRAIESGWLQFSDGSRIWVQMAGERSTTVDIGARKVTSLLFTVADVQSPGVSVGLDELEVSGDSDAISAGGDLALDAAVDGASPEVVDGDPITTSAIDSRVTLAWKSARELTRIELTGSGSSGRVARGRLEFSDGSSIPIGEVADDPTRPTVVAFMPRPATSVQLVVDETDGAAPVSLAEISVFGPSADPARPAGSGQETRAAAEPDACEPTMDRPDASAGLVIECPRNGAIVDRQVELSLSVAQGFDSVTARAWDDDATERWSGSATVDDVGGAHLTVDASRVAPGPFVVAVTADGRAGSTTVYLQLVRGGALKTPKAPAPAGRSLVFADNFNASLSASGDGSGADYAARKPESWGVTDFGSAVFVGPESGAGSLVQHDGFVELAVKPRPAEVPDPGNYGRKHVGALLASARPGGSGFSAQYGYFEARMRAPAAPGTWAAFWTLNMPNLVEKSPVTAELDTVELYGHDPMAACHTTHLYPDPEKLGEASCGDRWPTAREATGWHTYAVDVRPDRVVYFIDGKQVAHHTQVRSGDEPMFFLLDLALGGGWPVDLRAVGERASLYVDWVRVYV